MNNEIMPLLWSKKTHLIQQSLEDSTTTVWSTFFAYLSHALITC